MIRKISCIALLLALLAAIPGAGAEQARHCTIQCDRTDELFNQLAISHELGEKYPEMQERFLRSIPPHKPEGYSLSYDLVENVTVEAQGERMPLEEAISGGKITVDEILADVRRDAAAGICQESTQTVNGLTRFEYAYPEMELWSICDVLETPDGAQPMIRSFTVRAPGHPDILSTHFFDMSTPYHYEIDREDWGLEFRVRSATPEGITLEISQEGGQQFGQLMATKYSLDASGWQPLGAADLTPGWAVNMGGTSQLTIDWTQTIGRLESGDYCLRLHIEDDYDSSDVHPLARNFWDWQSYYIEFRIPTE